MIECTNQYIWYRKRKRFLNKRFFAIFIVVLFFLGLLLYYRFVVINQIMSFCSNYTRSYCTESVNKAVSLSLSDGIKYSDLIKIEKNSGGDIVLMTTDSYKINVINREIAVNAEKILKEELKQGIPIPLMVFSGISVLSGYGVIVNFKTISVSSVNSSFSSTFESVGINQTLHSIYIVVESEIIIKMPMSNKKSTCESKVLIGESVLVGKVPEVYLNGKLFTNT